MSDSKEADKATEFDQAWAEAGETDSLPADDAGRSDLPEDDKPGDEPAGTGSDAGGNSPADGDQTSDADRPAEGSENSDDLLAGLPEAVVARLREAERRAEVAQNTLKSNEARFSRAERERNEVLLRLQRLERETQEKEAPKPGAAAIDEAELDRVAEEYGDVGKPLAAAIKALQSEVVELRKAGASQAEVAEKEAELRLSESYAAEEQKLAGLHADWREVCSSEEFGTWLQTQPNAVRQAVLKNAQQIVDAEDGAFALDLFKASRSKGSDPEQKRREQQLDAGAHIPGGRLPLQPQNRGGGDYDSEWDRLDREQSRKAQGKR